MRRTAPWRPRALRAGRGGGERYSARLSVAYRNEGTGYPCAEHSSEKLWPSRRSMPCILASSEDLGALEPTGSATREERGTEEVSARTDIAYRNEGTGYPCAEHSSEKLCPSYRSIHWPLAS